VVETISGTEHLAPSEDIVLQRNALGIIAAKWKSQSKNFVIEGTGSLELDGYIWYKINLIKSVERHQPSRGEA
jgi:hypothetical protein